MNIKNKAAPSRKRFRVGHSTERNLETDDRASEDARATREALLLYVGCVRLLVHVNRSRRNLAAADTVSKKVIGTLASFVFGTERDLELLDLTPREILCTRNMRDLQSLLYPRQNSKGYQEYLKGAQIRGSKPDPITNRYGVNSTVNRHPQWEEHMVSAIIDQTERMEEVLQWAQQALWPRSRDLVIAEDSRALHLIRRLSIRESDIKSLGVWDAYREPCAPALGQEQRSDAGVSPVTNPVSGAGVKRGPPTTSAGARGASPVTHTQHTQGAARGQGPPAKAPVKTVKLTADQYRQRSERCATGNHESRITQIESTVKRLVDDVIPKLNAMKIRVDRLQDQCDGLEATVQNLQAQAKTDNSKQRELHQSLQACLKELQDGATKPQRRLRKDVYDAMQRLDLLEGKPEPVPVHVDTDMADALVPKISKCIKKEKKAYKKAQENEAHKPEEESVDAYCARVNHELTAVEVPEPAAAPRPIPDVNDHDDGARHWADEISEDEAAAEDEPDSNNEPAALGTYSPVAGRDPLEGTPNEPEAEGPQGIGASVDAVFSSLNC